MQVHNIESSSPTSKPLSDMTRARRAVKLRKAWRRERIFILACLLLFALAYVFHPHPVAAAWFGFFIAAYSAVANDSIQTIGTFIASNKERPWWMLWLYIGGIFLVTMTVGWLLYDGDVSYQRLMSVDKKTGELLFPQPTSFSFVQLAASIFLLILTRMKMPVSTTFLLLNAFTASSSGISEVFIKSIGGYLLAFGIAIVVWLLIHRQTKKWFTGRPHPGWVVAQWLTSGALWAVWLMQDAANIAVYLPRQLDVVEFLIFAGTTFAGLGLLFYLRGDRIQEIVDEKTEIADTRAATLVDLVYAGILLYKLTVSTIPMSTTWVFLGLLAGRELAIKISDKKPLVKTWKLIGKDLLFAFIGLLVSLIIAMIVNPGLWAEVKALVNQ